MFIKRGLCTIFVVKHKALNFKRKHSKKNKLNKKIIISVLIFLILAGIIFYAISMKNVAAVVNGEKIYIKRVDALFNSLPKGTNLTKKQILNQIIDTKVLVNYAEKNTYGLTDEKFSELLNKKLNENKLTLDELKSQLSLMGASMQDVKDTFTIENFVNSAILPNIKLTNEDIKNFRSTISTNLTDQQIAQKVFNTKKTQILQQIIEVNRKSSEIVIYANLK